ncbi:MAG TPA: hypothetical protein VHC22_09870 [Pirellulales bacterium]|nr:hypothetical protein [Pirellulales bacterium]
MPLVTFIHSLGSVGIFPSRAFLPAFVTALVLRFGHSIPWIAGSGLVGRIDAPSWFTSNTALIILGLLSLLELVATKSSELRELLDQFDGQVKAGMALLTSLGVASVHDAQVVRAVQQATLTDALFALMAAGAVYFFTSLRRSFYGLLSEMDASDALGLQKLFSWVEDAWVAFGAVALIVFPLTMILLTAIAFGLLYICQKTLQQREEQRRIACTACGKSIYPCAVACPDCETANAQACSVGWLGQSQPDRRADPEHHALHLIEVGRCFHCATRLTKSRPQQACERCGRDTFRDDDQLNDYLRLIDSRVPSTLVVCFALGLVPVVGVVPAILYYRFRLVNPHAALCSLGIGVDREMDGAPGLSGGAVGAMDSRGRYRVAADHGVDQLHRLSPWLTQSLAPSPAATSRRTRTECCCRAGSAWSHSVVGPLIAVRAATFASGTLVARGLP